MFPLDAQITGVQPSPFALVASELWFVLDPAGRFLYLNQVWQPILGWESACLMGQRWTEYIHPQDIPDSYAAYRQLQANYLLLIQNRYRHTSLEYRWLRWKMILQDDGCVYGTGQVITSEEASLTLVTCCEPLTADAVSVQESEATDHSKGKATEQLPFPGAEGWAPSCPIQHMMNDRAFAPSAILSQSETLGQVMPADGLEAALNLKLDQIAAEYVAADSAAQRLNSPITYAGIFQSLLDYLRPVVPYDVSGLILMDEDHTNPQTQIAEPLCRLFIKADQPLSQSVQVSLQQQLQDNFALLSNQGIADYPLEVHTLSNPLPWHFPTIGQLESSFMVPLIASPYEDNRIIGLLFLGAVATEKFTEEHIRLFYHAASHVSLALQRLRAFLLVAEKQRLARVLESLPIGVLLLDSDRHVLLANEMAQEFLDRFATIDANQVLQQLGDRTLEELTQCPPEDLSCREVTVPSYPEQVFEVISQPLVPNLQKSEGIVILRDISDRKRVEDEIRRALLQEQELNQLKSRIIRTVSHEYRSPLTVILGAAQVLEKYSTKLQPKRKQHLLSQIERAARNLSELIDQVLLANKTESGRLSFNPVPLEVVSFCCEIIEEVRLLGHFHHTLTFNCDAFQSSDEVTESGSELLLDPFLLRQILTNLLSNAIKFSPEGGLIVLILTREKNQIVFKVKDQGLGIPSEELPRLFEAFYRGRKSENIQGSGLGLNIVKKFVDLHCGKISMDSEDDVGTTFTVKLPC